MNRLCKRVIALLIAFLCVLTAAFSNVSFDGGNGICEVCAETVKVTEKRAVWISFLDFEKYLKDKSEAKFTERFQAMCDKAIDNEVNTLIVQVRAMSDAMYPSAYYPWSRYISSTKTNPGYDPLKIMVEIAHKKGLNIEAWINPYRVTNKQSLTDETKETSFYTKHKSEIMEYRANNSSTGDICLSLDPAKESVIKLINDGVAEIVKNYDVDGIHMDDYFYVTGMNPELSVVSKKENVNRLVKTLYQTVKSINPDCEFGISPAGNLDNARAQGADVDTWLSYEGYVDYLMPQIYWSDQYITGGKMTTLYTDRAKKWISLLKNDVKMYVGLALYRVGTTSSTDKGWAMYDDNMKKQYVISKSLGYSGYALFRYEWLEDSSAKAELKNLKDEINSTSGVYYSTHVQSYGWMKEVKNGETAGTVGSGKRLEALTLRLNGIEGDITYRTHVQSYGWMDWVSNGEMSGTSGESKRIEAIQIKLNGLVAEEFDVYYRVHVQTFGWLGWAKNGEPAGTSTYGKRLEAIEIKLVEKDEDFDCGDEIAYITRDISYTTHVQSDGWKANSFDGEMSGTSGRALRLEGIKISLTNVNLNGGVRYKTHVQSYGWQDWVYDGAMSGTSGKSKRLEAIMIELYGDVADEYDIYYRVHVQTYGWLDWVKNGELSGTTGESKRLEAIEIKLVPKNVEK